MKPRFLGSHRIASSVSQDYGRPQLRMPFVEYHIVELTDNERIKRLLRAGHAEQIR